MARLMNGEISKSIKNGKVYYRVSVGRKLVDQKSVIRDGRAVQVPVTIPYEFSLGTDPMVARTKRDILLEEWRQGFTSTNEKGEQEHFGMMQPKQFTYMLKGENDWTSYRAADLANDWEEAKDSYWNPEMLERVERKMAQLQQLHSNFLNRAAELRENADRLEKAVSLPVAPVSLPAPAQISKPSLYRALDEYKQIMSGKALSDSYKRRIGECADDLKYHFDAYKKKMGLAAGDCDLETIDRLWLEKITDYMKSCPPKRTGNKKPLKAYSVKTCLDNWRRFFDWVDTQSESSKFNGWEAPKKWQLLFDCDMSKLRTKAERDQAADGPEQIELSQIVKLYKKGILADNHDHQVWFLMGLFGSQGQKELSTVMPQEFTPDGCHFIHRRNKSGQKGQYWLPPELVKLLKPMLKGKEKTDLVFTTAQGLPLVTASSDGVRQAFDDWKQRAEVELPKGKGFYALRRYFSDQANKIGGSDLQTAALSHSNKTVGQRHYSGWRDFDGVERVGRKIYEDCVAAGMFSKDSKEEKKIQAA